MLNLWNVFDDVMRADPWFRTFPMGSEGEVASSSWPLVDVAEADNAYLIHAELPGVRLEDVNLEIENNVLTLSAQKRPDSDAGPREYHRMERSYGTFRRSFALPDGVETERVQAVMKDGVLTIHLLKSEQSRPRRIPIHVEAPTGEAAPQQLGSESQEPAAASSE